MKNTLSKIIGSTILATGVAVSLVAPPAQAGGLTLSNTTSFGFGNVFGGDKAGDSIFSQFNFNVSQTSTNKVLFQFGNTGSISDAFISQIKFSDASKLLSFNAFAPDYNVGNVSFASENKNLAQSNNISGWVDSFGFASTKQGAGKAGIDKGEKLGILFDANFDNVINSLKANQLKIGMHVQGIAVANGQSDVYVSNYVAPPAPVVVTPPVVTLPAPVVVTPPVVTPPAPVTVLPPVVTPPAPVEVPEPTTLVGLALAFGGMLASSRRQSH